MQLREVTVYARHLVPHPWRSFANLQYGVSLSASLDAEEDVIQCTADLQALADSLIEARSAEHATFIMEEYQAQQAEKEQRWREEVKAQQEARAALPDETDDNVPF